MPREEHGRYDVAKCEAWIAANIKPTGRADDAAVGPVVNPHLQERSKWAAVREENLARLSAIELEEVQKKLIKVDEVARVFERYISHARSLLEELPDRSLIELPKSLKPQVRKRIRERWVETVEDTLQAIADAAEEIGADKDT